MSKENKSYFRKVKEGQEVFGLVFGPGVVANAWGDGYYTFEVEYANGFTVPYTSDGVPGWSGQLDYQTVFYKDDIDMIDHDFAPTDEILSVKKIIKLRAKGKLEVKCPSGFWKPVGKCPSYITEDYLEEGKFHLFRKIQG